MSLEPVPSEDPSEIVSVLCTCIETSTDGEKGYGLAAADVRDVTLKAYFRAKEDERADFVLAAQDAVKDLGRVPENEGTAKGAVHRGFVGLRKVVEGRSDRLIVEECLRGEISAATVYETLVRKAPLDAMPATVRALVIHQYRAVQNAIVELRQRLGKLRGAS